MSPSWLEPFTHAWRRESRDILLAPYRVAFTHRHATEPPEELVLECDAETGWSYALATLSAGLERLAWRDADVRVRLSNHYVRYALVPALAKLRGRDERLLAARHQLGAIYGERAQRWQIAMDGRRGAPSALAAGAEQDLLQELVATLSRSQLRVQAVEPVLASAFNALRREIGKTPTWLCVAEPGRIAIAYLEKMDWRFVQTERLRGELDERLLPLLERACIANDAAPGRVLLVADAPPGGEFRPDAGWSLEWHPLGAATAQGVTQ